MEEWEECHSYHEILRVSFLITWNGDDKNILGEILARGLPRSIENQSCISRYKSKICGLKYSIYLGHFGTLHHNVIWTISLISLFFIYLNIFNIYFVNVVCYIIYPICSMVLEYLPTKLGDLVRANVGVHIPAPWVAYGYDMV